MRHHKILPPLAQRLLHEVNDMRRMLQNGQEATGKAAASSSAMSSARTAPKHAVQELAAIMQHAVFFNSADS